MHVHVYLPRRRARDARAQDVDEVFYWKGDKARYTGKSQMMHGGKFYEFVLLEGHLKGEKKWTQREPTKIGDASGDEPERLRRALEAARHKRKHALTGRERTDLDEEILKLERQMRATSDAQLRYALSEYKTLGEKAGKAARNKRMDDLNSYSNEFRTRWRLESDENKALASEAYEQGYRSYTRHDGAAHDAQRCQCQAR